MRTPYRYMRAMAQAALDAQMATIHRDIRRSCGQHRITQQIRQQGQCLFVEVSGVIASAWSVGAHM